LKAISSQSSYKINSGCPYYKASIAPNLKLLNDFEPSKEQLETVYGGIMEEVNELRKQIARKKTLSAMDHQVIKAKPSILILPKFKPKMLCFGFLMILKYLIGQLQIFYLQDYGFVRIFTTHLFSNTQLKKQFRNLQMQIFPISCFKMIQTMKKISW
jgi:hypothetical protein